MHGRQSKPEHKSSPDQNRGIPELTGLILDTTREMFAYLDPEMRLQWVNQAVSQAMRSSAEEMIGHRCYEFWHQRTAPCQGCPVQTALQTGQVEESELTTSDSRTWLVRGYPVFGEQGEISGVVQFGQDITERKRLDQELVKSKKLESVGILAGGIAHDFNNFLAIIMGNIELAQWSIDEESEAGIALEQAVKACQGAQKLTQKFLTFAQGGEPVPEVVDLEPVARDAASLSLAGSNVSAEYHFPQDLWQVNIDGSQIREALNQVFRNAREAMPNGGWLSLSARNVSQVSDRPGRALSLPDGEYVKLSVRDNGKGISQRVLPKIFDPYFTTKERGRHKGTGLGLTIAHSVVRKHGGHMEARSKENAGTTIFIYLPAVVEPPRGNGRPGKQRMEALRQENRKGRILVMDDEEMILDLARHMLHRFGYETVCVTDGDQALAAYRKALGTQAPFDAVILDLTVKGGMGGLETLKQLQAIDPEVTVLVTSGYANDPILTEYARHGFRGAIPKPYQSAELKEALDAALAWE
jgi:PAS domain S-box-containing protein